MTGWCKQCEKYITVDNICIECEPWCEKCYECCGSDDDQPLHVRQEENDEQN